MYIKLQTVRTYYEEIERWNKKLEAEIEKQKNISNMEKSTESKRRQKNIEKKVSELKKEYKVLQYEIECWLEKDYIYEDMREAIRDYYFYGTGILDIRVQYGKENFIRDVKKLCDMEVLG